MEGHHFQPISSIETDPSQQGILHSLQTSRNILIQGPPGTGKSQSLTAILINALENHRKTIVVCEKRTALEVLHNSLQKRGLGKHAVLIKDITKDRRFAVESVRDRVDFNSRPHSIAASNTSISYSLNYSIEKSRKLIDSINQKHLKIGKKLAGDRNWTQTVGVLLSNQKRVDENYKLGIDKKLFQYSSDELNSLLEILREGQGIYEDYKDYCHLSFLNTSKYTGENLFIIEREIKEAFTDYRKSLTGIGKLISTYKEEYIELRNTEIEAEIVQIGDQIKLIRSEYGSLIEQLQKSKKTYIAIRSQEIKNQVKPVREQLNKIQGLYDSSTELIDSLEKKYNELRNKETESQWKKISPLLDDLQNLFDKNSAFPLFYSDNKKFSFSTQIKSLFSAQTKSIVKDSRQIETNMVELINRTKECPDFPSLKNILNTEEKEENFREFKKNCEELFNQRSSRFNEEFHELRLESIFTKPTKENPIILDLETKANSIGISSIQKKFYLNALRELEKFRKSDDELIKYLNSKISTSRDLNSLNWAKSIEDRKGGVNNYLDYLDQKLDTVNTSAIKEYKDFFPGLENDEIKIDVVGSNLSGAFGKTNFKELKDFLIELKSLITQLEKKVGNTYLHIHKILNLSRDLKEFNSYTSSNAKIDQLKRIEVQIKEDKQQFDQNVKSELDGLSFLVNLPKKYINNTFNEILSDIVKLKNKIIKDDWVKDFRNESSPVALVEKSRDLLRKYEEFINHENDVFSQEFKWFKFFNDQEANTKEVIRELKEKKDWRNVFLVYYLDSLLTESADIYLPTDERDHEKLNNALSDFGQKQLDYIHFYWNSRQNKARKSFEEENPNLSIENLYNKRKSHRHQKLSLRQIINYDLDLFTDFFPIILTTPDVCSNLFQEKNKYFDIVLFDEASQLKLEDNLPAFLKGKQVVIAGDEHQMPPSNYFSKVFDGSVEDDVEDDDQPIIDRDNILLSCESLLDFASELKFNKRFLDFHYRSRHPYLIDFSNFAFYNQRLIPLPNNFDYTPINHIQVNGTYSDHTNEGEADAVLSILEKNIHKFPNGKYPSVGIATFNIAQRNLIKSRLIERRKFEKYKEFP